MDSGCIYAKAPRPQIDSERSGDTDTPAASSDGIVVCKGGNRRRDGVVELQEPAEGLPLWDSVGAAQKCLEEGVEISLSLLEELWGEIAAEGLGRERRQPGDLDLLERLQQGLCGKEEERAE